MKRRRVRSILLAAAVLCGLACTPSPQKSAPPVAPQAPLAAPNPAPSAPPEIPLNRFDVPLKVLHHALTQIPKGEKTPITLPRNTPLVGVSFALPDRLTAKTKEGRELLLGLCDTDFALLVVARHPDLRRLPQSMQYAVRGGFKECLDTTLRDPGSGIVLQGPQLLAKSPEQIGQAKEGVEVGSWQILKVLKPAARPGLELAYLVDAGDGQEGWISAHHLARGSDLQRGLLPSKDFYFLENQLFGNPLRYDSWLITGDFKTLRAFGANLTQGTPLLPRGQERLEESPTTSLAPMTIEEFLLPLPQALARISGLWAPLAYRGRGILTCDQLPTRLAITPQGQIQLTLGKSKSSFSPKRISTEGNGSLAFFTKSEEGEPTLRIYWGNVPKGQIRLELQKSGDVSLPLAYERIEAQTAKQLEEAMMKRQGCPK